MERFESVVLNEQPHVVLVVGDVNSTAAYALVAKKTWCRGDQRAKDFIPKLAHVEAELRSLDRTMPKEINRIVTDSVADYLFTTEEHANQNLLHEGIPAARISTDVRTLMISRFFPACLTPFSISQRIPVIFPAHPRTLKRIQDEDLGDYFVDHFVQSPEPWDSRVRIRLISPLGYLIFCI